LDPLTHVLTGVAISRSGLNHKTALSTLTLAIAAEIPDSDLIWRLKGPVAEFTHHRGFTHTFLGAPILDFVHVAAITPSPGIGVIFYYFEGNLRMTVLHLLTMLTPLDLL